jgi:hypothetical protein
MMRPQLSKQYGQVLARLGRPLELERSHRGGMRLLALGESERTQRRSANDRTGPLQEGARETSMDMSLPFAACFALQVYVF